MDLRLAVRCAANPGTTQLGLPQCRMSLSCQTAHMQGYSNFCSPLPLCNESIMTFLRLMCWEDPPSPGAMRCVAALQVMSAPRPVARRSCLISCMLCMQSPVAKSALSTYLVQGATNVEDYSSAPSPSLARQLGADAYVLDRGCCHSRLRPCCPGHAKTKALLRMVSAAL